MYVVHLETGQKFKVVVERVPINDYDIIKKSKRFRFNWNTEINNQVVKLRLKDSNEILGLMSLIDIKNEKWIKINLLESSQENIGRHKKYDRIAGCLIAYACKISFDKGYIGTVGLIPKTKLIEIYKEKYGMIHAGISLQSLYMNSSYLMKKYLTN